MRTITNFLAPILLISLAEPASAILRVSAKDISGPCFELEAGELSAEPPPACADAIVKAASPQDKAILYFAYAFALNERKQALLALPNLDKAIELVPDFFNALHERAYTRIDLGYYELGLADSNAEIALVADLPDSYRERALAKFKLGDLAGRLADSDKVIALAGPRPDDILARVEALIWLGRFDDAHAAMRPVAETDLGDFGKRLRDEIDRFLKYRPNGDPASRCEISEGLAKGALAESLIDDCTYAFHNSREPAKRADYLTTRSVARQIQAQSSNAGVLDLQIAAAIEPGNARRYLNLGFVYVSNSHSWAARNEFNKALAIEKSAFALAGRARVNYNLGEANAAFADAKASLDLEINEPALIVSGDLFFDRGDIQSAKNAWMTAYRSGDRSDDMLKRLKSVGVDDPANEPAK